MSTKPPVISIVGTTGVGKSQFSIELARAINGEIINADSMQIYKGLDQITNKHPIEERYGVPHHVMNHVGWTEGYDISRFSQEANRAIADIHARGKVPIIIGGTHYYLQNLLFTNKTISSDVAKVRDPTAEEVAILDGPVEQLWETLNKHDPVIAGKFHPQDGRKLRRALEVYYETGQRASDLYRDQKLEEMEGSSLVYNSLLFWVYCDREVLVPRLDTRVDKMIASGAHDEIATMYDVFQTTENNDCTSGVWQVIGFKEFLPWLKSGKADSAAWDEGVERMKSRTRQYAKSQVKWIRKLLGVELQKEAKFDWVNGGKLYLLDATDLDHWSETVGVRGINIARDFLAGNQVSAAQAPDRLMSMFPTEEFLSTVTSGKTLGSEKDWKHFSCDICKDGQGNPLVSVGEKQHTLHMKSRRHRSTKYKLEKRTKEEQYRRLKQEARQSARQEPENETTNNV